MDLELTYYQQCIPRKKGQQILGMGPSATEKMLLPQKCPQNASSISLIDSPSPNPMPSFLDNWWLVGVFSLH